MATLICLLAGVFIGTSTAHAFAEDVPESAVTCIDGSTSLSGTGACCQHGGVVPSTARPSQVRPAPSASKA
jgi:hypothetical protein